MSQTEISQQLERPSPTVLTRRKNKQFDWKDPTHTGSHLVLLVISPTLIISSLISSVISQCRDFAFWIDGLFTLLLRSVSFPSDLVIMSSDRHALTFGICLSSVENHRCTIYHDFSAHDRLTKLGANQRGVGMLIWF